jgi:2-polyprenyl-3-methyl-5-hydroxy-6-metoxy-1,4-benzoquinol methylase
VARRVICFAKIGRGVILSAQHCALITADPAAHLTVGAERAIYGLHQNTPEDAGYRTFLSRLAAPLLMRLQPGMQGLDSGCGPGPVLSMLLREAGMAMTDDAPFIECARIAAAIRLCCLHVVEHFRDPHAGWAQMMARVRPGAGLG